MPRFVYQNQEIRHYDQVMRGTAVVLTNKNGVKLVDIFYFTTTNI